jgi:hypothetical protein
LVVLFPSTKERTWWAAGSLLARLVFFDDVEQPRIDARERIAEAIDGAAATGSA